MGYDVSAGSVNTVRLEGFRIRFEKVKRGKERNGGVRFDSFRKGTR